MDQGNIEIGIGRDGEAALALVAPGLRLPSAQAVIAALHSDAEAIRQVGASFALPPSSPVITPRSGLAGNLVGLARDAWEPVEIADESRRVERVWLPRALVQADHVIVLADVREDPSPRPTVALGLWAQLAHPRQRLGARLTGAREGIGAEIAAAVRPDLVVAIDRIPGGILTLVTRDQVAADLAILALRQVLRRDDVERAGPWEDPLVQAATDLDLGVRIGSDLRIGVSGELPGSDAVVRRLADRLGAPPPAFLPVLED